MVVDSAAFAITGVPENDTTVIAFPNPANNADSIATIRRLSAELSNRRVLLSQYDAYYRGNQGIRFASSKYREAFGKMFSNYAENVCSVVVDAVEERLDVEGFRFPPGDESEVAGSTDPAAWRIWQDNGLKAGSQTAHTEALVKGIVYILVSPFAQDRIAKRSPRITIEDPFETIVEYASGTRERTVGLKRWTPSGAKRTYATLYFADRIEKWQSTAWTDANGAVRNAAGQFAGAEQWEQRHVVGEEWPQRHSLGVVPLVPLINKPRLYGDGESELKQIIPIQDAINKIAMDAIVASEATAFRQKYGTGIEIPDDPDTGKPIATWKPDVERILTTPVPDAKFGTFDATDLHPYVEMIDQKYRATAVISRTPYHYFQQHGGQPPSGESMHSAETGLVRKARRRHSSFGEGWEEVQRLAFRSLDDPKGDVFDSETKWANPESLTEAEHIDALIKKRSGLKVPLVQLWEDADYTPQQSATFPALLAAEAAMLAGTLVEPIGPDAAAQDQIQERTTP